MTDKKYYLVKYRYDNSDLYRTAAIDMPPAEWVKEKNSEIKEKYKADSTHYDGAARIAANSRYSWDIGMPPALSIIVFIDYKEITAREHELFSFAFEGESINGA